MPWISFGDQERLDKTIQGQQSQSNVSDYVVPGIFGAALLAGLTAWGVSSVSERRRRIAWEQDWDRRNSR